MEDLKLAFQLSLNDKGVTDNDIVQELTDLYMNAVNNDDFDYDEFMEEISLHDDPPVNNQSWWETFYNNNNVYFSNFNNHVIPNLPPNAHVVYYPNIALVMQFPQIQPANLTLFNSTNQPYLEDVKLVLTNKELDKLQKLNLNELQEQIKDIPSDQECCICMDKINNNKSNNYFTILSCKHYYHYDCITEYLKNYHYICPICKQSTGDHVIKNEEQFDNEQFDNYEGSMIEEID